jgi:peroxiredoxin
VKPRLRITLSIIAVIAFAGMAAYLAYFQDRPAPSATFTSIKGEKVTTSDLRGRVVLLNFWATDCAVCVREMPRLTETYRKFASRDFEMIAIAMRYDPPNYVLRYAEQNALPFKVALDPLGELAKAFGDVRLTPTTIIIDKQGNMIQRIIGEPDFKPLEALIERSLAQNVKD